MATRCVVGYRREDGVVRGTYVHNEGHPEHMVDTLFSKLQTLGFEGMKEWINKGVEGQGYSTVGSDPYNDGESPWMKEIDDEEYGYIIEEDRVTATQEGEFITSRSHSEPIEIQYEFLSYVKESMIEEYGVNLKDAEEIIKRYDFPGILKTSPEFIMHYKPKDWAYKLYEVSTKEGRMNNW